ncbi:MAG: long-chain fatty acid--CoA ligase [Alphaproteobacteria bacterium]|nr:long-chain fatty acid--CoA ligase [Alphaproteobacteria bacterium]
MLDDAGRAADPGGYDSRHNLPELLFDRAAAKGERPFLWAKRDGAWQSLSFAEAARRTRALAGGLNRLGIGRGDRVMLVAENRPEWLIGDIAIMAAGAVSVPAYVTNTAGDHLHVMADSGAKAVIVSTQALAARVLPAAIRAPALKTVIAMEPLDQQQSLGLDIIQWDDLLILGEPTGDAALPALERGDTACIIYTSGTGGAPKGVMLSHGALLCNCKGGYRLLQSLGLDDEVFLSFLPLSHSYEHTAGQFFPISIGAQIYYAEGVAELARNMAEVRPTFMTAVPRLYETMHGRITAGLANQSAVKRRLFEWTLALGRRRYEAVDSLGLLGRLADSLLDRLVRDKVRARFGGRMKALVSGGAPLNYEIGLFFTALGLRLLQGYGLTESAPVISCNPPEKIKLETVGPAFPDVRLRLGEDGEIQVQGELVMQGYWNNPAATAEAIRDGWLHTGDIGTVDGDGYIRITDRKKDLIVNSGGDNVSPARVEGFLTLQPEIAQAMVVGDRRPYLVALVVPDGDWAAGWAKANGKPANLEGLANDPNFHSQIAASVARVGRDLSVIERVRDFMLTAEPFTVENAMLTPSLKIRRHIILERHGAALEALYGGRPG